MCFQCGLIVMIAMADAQNPNDVPFAQITNYRNVNAKKKTFEKQNKNLLNML